MEPYLSIVTSSLDCIDENVLQIFVNTTLEQCRRHRIQCELIIVTSNDSLTESLRLPAEPGPCAVRLIEVPERIDLATGRNVGIRRVRGRYVLPCHGTGAIAEEVMEFVALRYARDATLEWNDIAPKDGRIGLGKGWFPREAAGSKPFRWFCNDAEIRMEAPGGTCFLAVDVEPGPGVSMGPAKLDVFDHEGANVLSVRLARRSVVNIPLPNHPSQVLLRLHVSDTVRRRGHRLSSRLRMDRRPLNGRVLGCGLYEEPVVARSWSLSKRIWWVLTRSTGSTLLPEPKGAGDWQFPSQEVTIRPREGWFDPRSEAWGLGAKRVKETCLVEAVPLFPPRPRRQLLVDLIGAPLVWFFRALPRPPLPPPGSFVHSGANGDVPSPLLNGPKISIVTPSYRQGPFLEWTMRSVLEQGYPNLEYVVMDGGSKDGTVDILSRYQDRLAYWESSPDEGQADAIVRGFEHTSGEIMAYLNSDDLLAPGALDFAARFFLEHPEVDAIYSHRVFIDERNIVTRYWILPEHSNWTMQRWDYIPQETCFWRRRIYEKVGGIDRSFQFALDYDLFVRFMRHGRMRRVNRFLGAFREHPSSKTTLQEGPHPEVDRISQERGIHRADWHRLPQLAQHEMLDLRSRRFAARGKTLPGALPGVGYDYDLVWGGRLSAPRSFFHSSSGTHRI